MFLLASVVDDAAFPWPLRGQTGMGAPGYAGVARAVPSLAHAYCTWPLRGRLRSGLSRCANSGRTPALKRRHTPEAVWLSRLHRENTGIERYRADLL